MQNDPTYRAMVAAGCAATAHLRQLASDGADLDALQEAAHQHSLQRPTLDQHAAALDSLLQQGFALLTQPSSHDGGRAIAAWRAVFTLAAVLRAVALHDSQCWALAARHVDLALLLGDAGPQLASALAPLLAQAAAGVRCDGSSGVRRSPRLAALSLGAAAALPRVPKAQAAELEAGAPPQASLHLLGGMGDWRALREGGWAASLLAVRQRLGHRTVPVEVGMGRWGGRAREGRQQRLMRLDDFLDEQVLRTRRPSPLEEASPLAVTPTVPVTAARCEGYVAQHLLFRQAPDLLGEIGLELLRRVGDPDPARTAQGARAWLGPEGTVTPLHFDWHDNVLCQLLGEKLVLLCFPRAVPAVPRAVPAVPPEEGGGEGGCCAACASVCMKCMYPCDGVPNASRVDAEAPDLSAFPRFAGVERRACLLRPGEALFVPRGVWHYARSLSPSLSVSFWFSRTEQKFER